MNLDTLRFPPYELPASLAPLRAEVREFLKTELGAYRPVVRSNTWDGTDAAFSRSSVPVAGWA